jgi:iron(III) transport system ATP-binding protein
MTGVRLENISKRFGSTTAVSDVSLDIQPGELFFLLGPSGCGKSTLLRLIAGLLHPNSGKIFFNDKDVTRQSTQARNAVMVFQSYALWPHLTVRENVGFGLEIRKIKGTARTHRIGEVLKLVQLEQYANRKPNELSGGQQQRVALARALAVEPKCLLLDEPLSNLDAKLRTEMRSEIRRICKKAGCTTIYVTHDQKEALSIADRIAVIEQGRIAQIGTPAELYNKPGSRFVAEFIGQTNVLPGRVLQQERGLVRLKTPLGDVMALANYMLTPSVTLAIRPEQMRVVRSDGIRVMEDESMGALSAARNRFIGTPVESTFLGETSEHLVEVDGTRVRVVASPAMSEVPEEMLIEFDAESVIILGQ